MIPFLKASEVSHCSCWTLLKIRLCITLVRVTAAIVDFTPSTTIHLCHHEEEALDTLTNGSWFPSNRGLLNSTNSKVKKEILFNDTETVCEDSASAAETFTRTSIF